MEQPEVRSPCVIILPFLFLVGVTELNGCDLIFGQGSRKEEIAFPPSRAHRLNVPQQATANCRPRGKILRPNTSCVHLSFVAIVLFPPRFDYPSMRSSTLKRCARPRNVEFASRFVARLFLGLHFEDDGSAATRYTRRIVGLHRPRQLLL